MGEEALGESNGVFPEVGTARCERRGRSISSGIPSRRVLDSVLGCGCGSSFLRCSPSRRAPMSCRNASYSNSLFCVCKRVPIEQVRQGGRSVGKGRTKAIRDMWADGKFKLLTRCLRAEYRVYLLPAVVSVMNRQNGIHASSVSARRAASVACFRLDRSGDSPSPQESRRRACAHRLNHRTNPRW